MFDLHQTIKLACLLQQPDYFFKTGMVLYSTITLSSMAPLNANDATVNSVMAAKAI